MEFRFVKVELFLGITIEEIDRRGGSRDSRDVGSFEGTGMDGFEFSCGFLEYSDNA